MIEYITAHLDDFWMIFATTVTLASLVVKLTPSSVDDAFVAKILQFIALNKK
jgi:hypothetical protein